MIADQRTRAKEKGRPMEAALVLKGPAEAGHYELSNYQLSNYQLSN